MSLAAFAPTKSCSSIPLATGCLDQDADGVFVASPVRESGRGGGLVAGQGEQGAGGAGT